MKKFFSVLLLAALLCTLFTGCGGGESASSVTEPTLPAPATAEQLLSQEPDATVYEMTLTPAQVENFESARFFLARRFGQDRYLPFYISENVSLEGSRLVADFNGKIIYLVNDAGLCNPLVTREEETEGNVTCFRVAVGCSGVQLPDGTHDSQMQIYEAVLSFDRESGQLVNCDYALESEGADQEGIFTPGQALQMLPVCENCAYSGGEYCYLTRSEDGSILPLNQWMQAGGSWFEMDSGEGLRFLYGRAATITSPYDMNISGLFLVMEIKNKDGSVWCGEPMEVPVLQTRMPAVPKPATLAFTWEEGNSLRLWEQDGITVILRKDVVLSDIVTNESGISYVLELKNDTQKTLNLSMDQVLYNGRISGDTTEVYYVEPGQWKEGGTLDFGPEAEVLQQPLRSLSFRMVVAESGAYATGSLVERWVHIQLTPESTTYPAWVRPVSVTDAYMEFMAAENQVLFSRDGLRVTLLRMGATESNPDLTGVLQVENTDDEERWVSFGGTVINGSYFPSELLWQLQPGEVCFELCRVTEQALTKAGITAIGQVELLLDTGRGRVFNSIENLVSCPVAAMESSRTPSVFAEGEQVLFEEKGVRICLRDTISEAGKTTWVLTVKNDTDHNISFTVFDSFVQDDAGQPEAYQGLGLNGSKVAAHSCIVTEITAKDLTTPVYTYLRLMEFGDNTILQVSKEPLCLTP